MARRVVGVADWLDIEASGALYRVFLLTTSLQVDLSFWPHDRFRPTGGPMRLVFGDALPAEPPGPTDHRGQVRTGWLFALHAAPR